MAESELSPLLSNSHTNSFIQPPRKKHIACAAVLLTTLLERLAFYSLFENLPLYLTSLNFNWDASWSNSLLLVAFGVQFGSGLLAGWLSDTYFGRFKTIILGYGIYIIGYTCFPIFSKIEKSNNSIDPQKVAIITTFLLLAAVGAGIVRTNLAAFGGDQVRNDGTKATVIFFSLFYGAINIGSVVALAGVMFLQQKERYFLGYLIPELFLGLSLVIFLCGSSAYVKRSSESRLFTTIYRVYKNAYDVSSQWQSGVQRPLRFIDYAKHSNGGAFDPKQVDDIRDLWTVCAVYTLLIPYWICYSQLDRTLFNLQGLQLRIDFSDSNACPNDYENFSGVCMNDTITNNQNCSTKITPEFLTLFNSLSILLMLPLTLKIYSVFASRGVAVQTWKRLVIGMFLVLFSLAAGGVVETFRLANVKKYGIYRQKIENVSYDAAPELSIWLQIPQWLLLGASEVFTIVAGIEYSFMMSPPAYQGIIMGLYYTFWGIGTFIGVGVLQTFFYISKTYGDCWICQIWKNPKNLNCSRLDYYFYFLGIVLFFFIVLFLLIVKYCDLKLNKPVFSVTTNHDQLPAYDSSSNINRSI